MLKQHKRKKKELRAQEVVTYVLHKLVVLYEGRGGKTTLRELPSYIQTQLMRPFSVQLEAQMSSFSDDALDKQNLDRLLKFMDTVHFAVKKRLQEQEDFAKPSEVELVSFKNKLLSAIPADLPTNTEPPTPNRSGLPSKSAVGAAPTVAPDRF